MSREFVDIFDEWIHSYEASVGGEDPEYRDVFKGYEEILNEVVKKAFGTVLEFGTGTGNLTEKLITKGLDVIGIEPNAMMRKVAMGRLPKIEIKDGDLLDFETDGIQIDSIVSTYVFHHLTDVDKGVALKKYSELLPENGKVIFADTVFVTEEAKREQVIKERARDFHKVADDLEREYYTTLPIIIGLFMEAGFEVTCKQLNDYVWLMDATKKEEEKVMKKMNVESFNLDHTKVAAPYVRLAGRKTGAQGDEIYKYDLRFTQPNKEFMKMDALHSIEHIMAENIRNYTEQVVDLSPMGCQTGFYLTVINHEDYDDILSILENTLQDVLAATEVPACNVVQCGWAENHSLEGAKELAKNMLSKKDEWRQVYAEEI